MSLIWNRVSVFKGRALPAFLFLISFFQAAELVAQERESFIVFQQDRQKRPPTRWLGPFGFEFSFREAYFSDSLYRRFVRKHGNEIFDFTFSYGVLKKYLWVRAGAGFMIENGRRHGLSGRVSQESIELLLIRPHGVLQARYPHFVLQPFIEAGFAVYYFKVNEKGTLPAQIDGWKGGLISRGGFQFSTREFARLLDRPYFLGEEYEFSDLLIGFFAAYERLDIFKSSGINFSNVNVGVGLEFHM